MGRSFASPLLCDEMCFFDCLFSALTPGVFGGCLREMLHARCICSARVQMICSKAFPATNLPDVPYCTEVETELGRLVKLLLSGHN